MDSQKRGNDRRSVADMDAEEALRLSEQRFRLLVETTSDWVWQIDRDGFYSYAGPKVTDLLGYAPEEILGKTPFDLMPADEAERVAAIFRSIAESRTSFSGLENINRHKDGRLLVIETNGAPLFDDRGEYAGYMGFDRDITDRKRAEEALRESEAQFRDLAEKSVAGVYLVQDNRFMYVNAIFAEIVGYGIEELIRETEVRSILFPEDWPQVEENLGMRISGALESLHSEFRIVTKTGKVRNAEVYSSRTTYGGKPAVIGTLLDVTEKKQAEEKYRSIFDNAIMGIFQSSPEGAPLNLNRAHARFLGYDSPEEFLASIKDLGTELYVNQGERDRVTGLLNKHGTLEGCEVEFYRKDGQKIWVSLNVRAVSDSGGRLLYYEGTAEDITRRKEAEAALRLSESRLRQVIDLVPHLIFAKDRTGRFILANKTVADIYGTTVENLTGKTDSDFNPDKIEVARFVEDDLAVIDSGRPMEIPEERITDTTGRARILRTIKIPFTLSTTGADAVLGVSTDITEYKRAEEALKESENKYRAIFENAVEGIFQTAVDGRLISVNPSFARMVGFNSPEEMMAEINHVGQQLYVHPEDRVRLISLLKEQGYAEDFEAEMLHKSGRTIWTSLNPRAVRDGEGEILYIEGTIEDITKRKQAELAVLESEAKYRTVVENSLAAFYIVQDGLVRFVNQRFSDIAGYSSEEVVNKMGPLDLIHPDDRAMVEENMEKRLRGETERIEYDFRVIARDGRIMTVKAFGSTMNYNGRLAVCGTFIEITRERYLESQLRQAQKMEALGQLAGGIAHDFNNILTALSGYGSLLSMKMEKDNPLRVYVDQILSAAQKAAGLTGSLLTFSRQQAVALSPVDINQVVKKTKNLLKRLVTEDITLETCLTSDPLTIMGDANQVDQILFNLATNARDAMKHGGTITIETQHVILDEEFMRIHGFGKPGRYALLAVSDTGAGMDEATRQNIFDPFFTTKEVGKGTGLGLSTVHGIVRTHGGGIMVESAPGAGTRFLVYFPETRAGKARLRAVAAGPEGGSETILLAEDNEGVRQFLEEILCLHGYTVIVAPDGEAAVDLFGRHEEIALLILDSVMPRKNGRQVYDEITRIKPGAKVLFISGYTRDVVLDKGVQEKEFAFISKPLSAEDLLRKVREVLDSPSHC